MSFITAILFIVISSSLHSTITAKIEDFTKEWSFSGTSIFSVPYYGSLGKNNDFVSMTCTKSECKLVYDYFGIDGKQDKKECSINIETDKENTDPMIITNNAKKVIISHTSKENSKGEINVIVKLVDMSSCNIHDNHFPLSKLHSNSLTDSLSSHLKKYPNVFLYDDGSHDIFLLNVDLCNAARCKIHVDSNGKHEELALPYLPENIMVNKISMFPTDEKDSYFAVAKIFYTSGLNFLDAKKKVEIFQAKPKENQILMSTKGRDEYASYDYSNKLFGYCFISEPELSKILNCEQRTLDGQIKVNETITIDNQTEIVTMANLRDGELALLIKDENSYSLYKIPGENQNPTVLGDLNVLEITWDTSKKSISWSTTFNLIPTEDSSICVSKIDSRFFMEEMKILYKLLRKCFTLEG